MEEKEIKDRDNIGMFYSKDGRKFFLVGIGEVWEYTLPVPFSYDFSTAVYIGRQELMKCTGGGVDNLTEGKNVT